jgi:tRNA-specific 2-thiouridylase
VHWQTKPNKNRFTAKAKIRYRQPDQQCVVTIKKNSLAVDFEKPQRAITPGQSIVLYQRDKLLGGAVIK